MAPGINEDLSAQKTGPQKAAGFAVLTSSKSWLKAFLSSCGESKASQARKQQR